MHQNNIVLKKLLISDCQPSLIAPFNRYQEVSRCWRKVNACWRLVDETFIQQWDEDTKLEEIQDFIRCINMGGVVLGAFLNDVLVGFTFIQPSLFGVAPYIRLKALHVSYGYRAKGLGKKLFMAICCEAKQLGAHKLYITAFPAEDTIAFYRARGCVELSNNAATLFAEEPKDVHLEYELF